MSDSRRPMRLASEAAVIIVSILLAFSIDAWWENRQQLSRELTLLESVRDEAEENGVQLDRMIERNRLDLERAARFLGSTPEELRSLAADSVSPWVGAIVIAWTYDGDVSAAKLLLDSSTPVTDRGYQARAAIAEWVRVLEDAEEEKATMWALGTELTGRLAAWATPVAGQGQGLLPAVAGRLGPEVLAQLRMDEGFVAATLNKMHHQNIYLFELYTAVEALNEVRSVLEVVSNRSR